jgi:hypothetical protein
MRSNLIIGTRRLHGKHGNSDVYKSRRNVNIGSSSSSSSNSSSSSGYLGSSGLLIAVIASIKDPIRNLNHGTV